MSSLETVVREIQSELVRCSQRLDGRDVLPNHVDVVLPSDPYGNWAPVLADVTAEIGEAIVEWADRCGHAWYGGVSGPSMVVSLSSGTSLKVDVHHGEPSS